MRFSQTLNMRLKSLGLSILGTAFALNANAQDSPIPKSFENVAVPTSAQAAAQTDQASKDKLDEVVVVGYGTVRKKDVTGAVASVGAKEFNLGVIASPDQLIQGKVAGVQIAANSGQPGGANTIKIRGNSSIRQGNNPLFVVDGIILDGTTARPDLDLPLNGESGSVFPSSNPLNFINTADIASMEVLKDASATAIYGSRGANGVIVITTKAAKAGETRLEVGSSLGIATVAKKIDVMDAAGYMAAQKSRGLSVINGGSSVDAQEAIFRTALTQNYNLSATGGSDKAKFRFSGMYQDQEGVVRNSGFQKVVANLASSFKLLQNNKLKLDVNATLSQTNESLPAISNNADATGDLLVTALQWNPTVPLRQANGMINAVRLGGLQGAQSYGGDGLINPLELIEGFSDKVKMNTILASIAPSYEIADGLVAKFQYSLNSSVGERKASIRDWVNKQTTRGSGWAGISTNNLVVQQYTTTLNYVKEINKDLSINAVVGYEYYVKELKGSSAVGRGFGSVAQDYTNILQYSTATTRLVNSFFNPTEEIQSFFGRVNANYQDKYLATATLRADGSSKFGTNSKYGFFPSVGLAWNIHNEDFLKDNTTLSALKLRGGWGITGNQEFPAGSAVSRIAYNSNGASGQSQLANPNLQWQQDIQVNLALEYGLLKNRITGTVEFFKKTTNNLLYAANAADPGPGTRIWKNLDGSINNTGVEFLIQASLVQAKTAKDFALDMGINYSYIKNSVTGLPASIITGNLYGQGSTNAFAELIANDQPLNVMYTRPYEGIVNGQSVYPQDGAKFDYLGNPNPTSLLGINTIATYMGFTLNMTLNGAFGQSVFNNTDMSVISVANLVSGRNVKTSIGSSTENVANRITPSARYIESASYLRINNLTLGYDFGKVGLVRNFNLYVTAQNLYTFTSYTGYDPEVNSNASRDGVPSLGIDYVGYPQARTFIFGLKLSL